MNLRNRLIIAVLILTVTIALIFSCIRRNDAVETILSSMLSTKINLSLSYMECFPNSVITYNDLVGRDSISKYTLVVFTDSTECTSCNVSRISNWEEVTQDFFFDSCRSARLVFIFSPSQKKIQEVRQIVEESSVDWPIYLDTANVFQRSNKQIPDNQLFHVFLLNENNEILCVGNPLYNEKLRNIYKRIIKGE